jgi:hypothetical protein
MVSARLALSHSAVDSLGADAGFTLLQLSYPGDIQRLCRADHGYLQSKAKTALRSDTQSEEPHKKTTSS